MKNSNAHVTTMRYSAGLTSQSFWFVELKRVVLLLDSGVSDDEIYRRCMQENLLGTSKPYRTKRIYGYLMRRAKAIEGDLCGVYSSVDIANQKLISLIAVILSDKLFFEFVNEVYREKYRLGASEISTADVNVFFTRKQKQSETVAAFSDATIRKLKSTFLNFLTEAGLITQNSARCDITPIVMDIMLERCLLSSGMEHIYYAITGAR